jgi:hypothetical protein
VPGILAVIGGTVLALAVGMSRRRASVWVHRGVTVALLLLGVSALWFLVEASLWTIYLTSHTVTASVSMRTFTHVVGPSSLDSVAAAVATAAAGWWVVRSPGQYRVA